ncbi:50S ribosomal protein L31 [Candidatus Microgenomates bacterium]|nr:50S ribosomal protein L31 [Candidatus Microgenomates bacterium]
MKKKIHPKWYSDAKVTCSCGNSFTVGSTKSELHVEICSACHPFFTGKMRYLDIMGRVEKFQAKREAAATKAVKKKKEKRNKEKNIRPESLKEMLGK